MKQSLIQPTMMMLRREPQTEHQNFYHLRNLFTHFFPALE